MKSLQYLNKYFWKYKWRLAVGLVMIICSNLFGIYPPKIIRTAFDTVAEEISGAAAANPNAAPFLFEQSLRNLLESIPLSEKLFYFGVIVLILALLKGLFTFLMRQTIIVMSRLIEYDLKNEVYDQYQRLGAAFYKKQSTGDLMNRISEDVSRVRMYLGPGIMYTLNLAVLFTLVIATMVSVNLKLTLYVLLPLPILSLTIYYVSNIINRKSEAVQRQLSKLTTSAQETFSGIRILKAFAREGSASARFEASCNDYKSKSLELVKVNALFHPFMILLIGLSTLLTVYIGGMEAIAGNITIGNIAEFVIYVNMLTWPVAALGWVTSLVQRAAASQERINEFLLEKAEIGHETGVELQIEGKIEFKNVKFIYPESGVEALKDISFIVESGQSLAVLGRTGSGKSTIAQLINRLYDASDGEIIIDGHNIKDIKLKFLRSSIGYIPQDVFLFSDSIRSNISFGSNSVPEEKIQQVAKGAALLDDISEFPEGLETMLGERGITLSGGQKQRVSIARGIVNDPSILIFDDCLSAVDTATEEQILMELKEIMKNKTTIIVSHRVSSIKHADSIIVIDEGKIKESGNHSSLLAYDSLYSKLYHQQLLEEKTAT
ncbi:MAG: ABC transporter ATP-binding protein [Flavobacteriales bacterium]|nr:ABC transporter ATP-binding protein [Flavobacteriales bacterium]